MPSRLVSLWDKSPSSKSGENEPLLKRFNENGDCRPVPVVEGLKPDKSSSSFADSGGNGVCLKNGVTLGIEVENEFWLRLEREKRSSPVFMPNPGRRLSLFKRLGPVRIDPMPGN